MLCPKCQTENLEGNQFCVSCGSPLISVAPISSDTTLGGQPPQNTSNYQQLPQQVPAQRNPIFAAIGGFLIAGPLGAISCFFIWRSSWEKRKKIITTIIAIILSLLIQGLIAFGGLTDGSKNPISNSKSSTGSTPTLTTIPVTSTLVIPFEYQTDTNADGIPDFIEKNTKYDWQKDECLDKIKGCLAPEMKEGQVKPKNIVIIFDSSGSMGEVVNGAAKILAAKNAVKKFTPTIPGDVSLAFIVYGHKGNNSAAGKAVSCAGVETLYPLGPVNQNSLILAVDGFQPTGWTPLATAISTAKDILANHKNDNNQVILLTDGQETCEGDPVGAARALKEVNAKTVVDVIAFAVSGNDRTQLQRIAEAGGGKYTDVNSESEIDQVFKESSNRFNTVLYQGCATAQTNDYTSCMTWRLSAAQDYLNKTLIPNVKYGSEEYKTLRQVMTNMYDEVTRQSKEILRQLDEFLKNNPIPTLKP